LARASANNLQLRIISALVLGPVVLLAVWLWPPWPLLPVLVIAAAGGMGFEWARLADSESSRLRRAAMVATPALAALASAFGAGFAAAAVTLLGAFIVLAEARFGGGRAPLWAASGTLWLAGACAAFLGIAGQGGGRIVALWLLALVWGSDIGAYAAGRALGGPKLAPTLSPNKTWAGFGGGLVAAAAVGAVTAALLGRPILGIVGVSLFLGLAAQIGDLVESLAKRRFGVKDSGGLIPGHGGLLDRLDSLLAAALALGLLTLAWGESPLLWQMAPIP